MLEKQGSKKTLRYVVMVIIAAVFLWLAFRNTDVDGTLAALALVDPVWLGFAVIILALTNIIRAERWRIIYRTVKAGIPFIHYYTGISLGNLFNFLIPRTGDLARLVNFSRTGSTPVGSALSTIVLERVLDLLTLLLFLGGVFVAFADDLDRLYPSLRYSAYGILGVSAGFLLFLGLAYRFSDPVLSFTKKLLRPLPDGWSQRIVRNLESFISGCGVLLDPARYFSIVGTSVFSFFAYGFSFFVVFRAFPMEYLGMTDAMLVMTISTVGLAVQAPVGSGFHFFCILALNNLRSVPLETATAFSIAYLAVMAVGNLVIAAVSYGLQVLKLKKS